MFSMAFSYKKAAGLIVRYAIVIGSIFYLFFNLDLAGVWEELLGQDPVKLLAVSVAYVALLFPTGARLYLLARKKMSLWIATKATTLCLGANNLFPGKAGELLKATYMSRHGSVPLGEAICLVGLERLGDLNAALLLALAIGVSLQAAWLYAPLMAVVVFCWSILWFCKKWPHALPGIARRLHAHKLVSHIESAITDLTGLLDSRRLFTLLVFTGLLWLLYVLFVALCLNWMSGLGLTMLQCMYVTGAMAAGMSAPAGPASIGVFEAATVAALVSLGVDKDQALIAALTLHISQVVPVTLLGGKLMLSESLGVKDTLMKFQTQRVSGENWAKTEEGDS
jgi:hypothetical protein